jgi:hypothetical protein
VPDLYRDSERFICASERRAVVILPSLTSVMNYDTGLVADAEDVAAGWVRHVEQAYLAARRLHTRAAIAELEVL